MSYVVSTIPEHATVDTNCGLVIHWHDRMGRGTVTRHGDRPEEEKEDGGNDRDERGKEKRQHGAWGVQFKRRCKALGDQRLTTSGLGASLVHARKLRTQYDSFPH